MEENKNKNEMQIPEHCSQGWEISEGFGKSEVIKALIFLLSGIVIGFIIMILFTHKGTTVVLIGGVGAIAGYVFCVKERYSRQSLLENIIDLINYNKSQKYYEWRRINE